MDSHCMSCNSLLQLWLYHISSWKTPFNTSNTIKQRDKIEVANAIIFISLKVSENVTVNNNSYEDEWLDGLTDSFVGEYCMTLVL